MYNATTGDYSFPSTRNPFKFLGEAFTDLTNYVVGNHNKAYLEDRAHTEMREDTAYQRAVADMQKAGLNPLTVGNGQAASSSSTVGASDVDRRLSLLGSLLDVGNLNVKNKQVVNNLIGNILGFVADIKG